MGLYVDISSNNLGDGKTIDLAAYWAAGYRDLMLKATEGTDYYWDQMAPYAARWHGFGGRVGYYHWLYGAESPDAQHSWFWGAVAPSWRTGDWLMTDFEDKNPAVSDARMAQVLSGFNYLCRMHGAHNTYTGNWYLADRPACTAYLVDGRWPVTLSDYESVLHNPYQLNVVSWQFTDAAHVPGFSAPVDFNRWLAAPERPQTIQPTPITTTAEDEDMNAFVFAYKNAIWCCDTNLKSKRGFATPPDYREWAAGKAAEGAKVITRHFSDGQCAQIPTGTGA